MRILVTGALGFIGAHFVERAVAAGHQVRGLYRSERLENRELLQSLLKLGADLRVGDIRDSETVDHAVQGMDCVCHFAAAFNDSGPDEHFENINVRGTGILIDAAIKHGARRFVFCSTAGIYGQRIQGLVDERSPTAPWNIYERTKLAAEQLIRECAARSGIEYVILRPTAVYGPRDERLLKLFRPVAQGRFPLFGKGDGRRHLVYVTDVADAFLLACTSRAAANEEMIIAGPQAVPLRQLLETIAQIAQRRSFGPRLPLQPMLLLASVVEQVCRHVGVKPPISRRRMDFYLNDAAFDDSHARRVLGWSPKVDLPEGLARTLADANATRPGMDRKTQLRA